MTSVTSSVELSLKSKFDTASTVAIFALSVVLLVAWMCCKSFKQFTKYGRFTILVQMCNRKRPPEENEDNCSQMASGGSSVSLQEIPNDNESQQSILLQKGNRKPVPEENEDNCSQMASGGSFVSLQEIPIDYKSQQSI